MDVIKGCFRFSCIVIDAKTTILICNVSMLFIFCKNLSNDIIHIVSHVTLKDSRWHNYLVHVNVYDKIVNMIYLDQTGNTCCSIRLQDGSIDELASSAFNLLLLPLLVFVIKSR